MEEEGPEEPGEGIAPISLEVQATFEGNTSMVTCSQGGAGAGVAEGEEVRTVVSLFSCSVFAASEERLESNFRTIEVVSSVTE